MHSPKKESCIKEQVRNAGRLASVAGFFTRSGARDVSSEALKLRDKALPDRLVVATLICDTIVIVYGLIFSFWIRFQTPLREVGVPTSPKLDDYAGYIAFGAVALILMLTNFGVYERNALLRFRFVSLQSLKACFWWAAAFLSISLILQFEPPISRLFIFSTSIITPCALLGWRWLLHRYLARSFVAVNLRQRVLFVGWNKDAEHLAKEFESDPVSAYQVVGWIASKGSRFPKGPETQMLGHYEDLMPVLRERAIDMVILTDVNGVKGDIVGLANVCEREMVDFKVVPSYFQILVSGLHLDTVSGVPILGVSRLPLDRSVNIFLKRLTDVIGAIVGLILALPIMAVFGAIVYWESPGPILYRQRRIGRSGLEFDILKIRSMKLNAEVAGKVGWTTKDDPRRLRIGALMRRLNIDEVPQFWNVLKGEMSLVGPRPERPELIKNFKREIPHYQARHNAKPGITGWAQVNGLRGDTDLNERIKCDLWYLENWNLFLDFQIMFMTFVKNKNAA
jgi:exopolysaccharide biosynthesis polyprenyl glycosylphosphotransferase